jgi:hypothetical protein
MSAVNVILGLFVGAICGFATGAISDIILAAILKPLPPTPGPFIIGGLFESYHAASTLIGLVTLIAVRAKIASMGSD